MRFPVSNRILPFSPTSGVRIHVAYRPPPLPLTGDIFVVLLRLHYKPSYYRYIFRPWQCCDVRCIYQYMFIIIFFSRSKPGFTSRSAISGVSPPAGPSNLMRLTSCGVRDGSGLSRRVRFHSPNNPWRRGGLGRDTSGGTTGSV